MAEIFYEDNNGGPFMYDDQSRKLFRVEADRRVDISDVVSHVDIRHSSVQISEERAMELARAIEEDE